MVGTLWTLGSRSLEGGVSSRTNLEIVGAPYKGRMDLFRRRRTASKGGDHHDHA